MKITRGLKGETRHCARYDDDYRATKMTSHHIVRARTAVAHCRQEVSRRAAAEVLRSVSPLRTRSLEVRSCNCSPTGVLLNLRARFLGCPGRAVPMNIQTT